MRLSVDLSGRPPATSSKDVLFCRAALEDVRGTIVGNAWANVAFGVTGGASLVGINPSASEAGIASILVQKEPRAAIDAVFGLCIIRGTNDVRVIGASLALTGRAPGYEIRYTTDGSVPGASSKLYREPVTGSSRVRAALVSRGQVRAILDEATPKYRIPASVPPEKRDSFGHG
jgi:hypothetical protein